MGKLSAAAALTAPAVDDYFWVYDASDPTNLKRIAHANLCVTGTFTPELEGAGGGTATHTTAHGRYSKIGNLVNFNVLLVLSDKTAISGNLQISNLPYASASIDNAACAVTRTIGFTTTGTAYVINAYVNASSTEILLGESNGLVNVALTDADMAAATTIAISGTYIAA